MSDELEIERLAMDILATVASAIYEEEPEASAARVRKLAGRIVRERNAAVKAERERCAVAAETMPAFASPKDVAAAIRAMGVK